MNIFKSQKTTFFFIWKKKFGFEKVMYCATYFIYYELLSFSEYSIHKNFYKIS